MASNSAAEQTDARAGQSGAHEPIGRSARFGISLNQGLPAGTISTAPKQVLAMNDFLNISADHHSNWMLLNSQFDHVEQAGFPSGRTGLNPDDRMSAAGYVFAGPIISSGEKHLVDRRLSRPDQPEHGDRRPAPVAVPVGRPPHEHPR